MGVYIKMEMPKDCLGCPMVSGYEIADEVRTRCSTVRCRLTNTKRPVGEAIAPDCPLIHVPGHGRLGDLDKLESGLRNMAKYQDGERQQGILGCCETIRLAPTIIPAEEGE